MMTDFEHLIWLGQQLDARSPHYGGRTGQELLMPSLLRIRNRAGALAPLALNRAQIELARDRSPRKIILKARQLGVTTWVAARFFLRTITHPGTLTVQVAHDQESAEEIFKIVHRFLENLPEPMRLGPLRTSRANVRQIVFPELDSEYRVATAADPNAGRGLTIQNLHCSEVARWPRHAAATLASLRAAVPANGEIVLESTPNGAAGCFYDEWQRAAESGYSRHFFPWWHEPAYQLDADPHPLTAEEIELAQRHGLSSRQIAYRRDLQASFRGLAPQEFCEDAASCFLASGECVFELAVIEKRLEFAAQQYCEQRENGALCVWYPATASRQYIIGVDPAGGGSEGDYSCAQVIDRATGLQCAELRGHFPPRDLAHRAAALAAEYNHALLVIERNNHGHGVLAHLQNVVNQAVAGRVEQAFRPAFEPAKEGRASAPAVEAQSLSRACRGNFSPANKRQKDWALAPDSLYEKNGQLGWLTTAANRGPMLANLSALLATEPRLFNSPRLLEECKTFVRQPNGTASAAIGAHDDCVLAMAIAQQVRSEVRSTNCVLQSSQKAQLLMPPKSRE